MLIIGITGTLGAGKGTIVEYLIREKGFAHFSARGFIVREVKRRGLPVNRDTMTPTADSLRREHAPSYIIDELYREAEVSGKNSVIESVRAVGEVESLRKRRNFVLFAIDADPHVRFARIQERKSETDRISFEKFLADEAHEFANVESHRGNIQACMALADYRFENNGTVEELEEALSSVVEKLLAAQS